MITAPSATATTPPPRHRWRIVLLAIGVVIVVLAVVIGIGFVRDVSVKVPSFPSLAANPDDSLHGTVAYFADSTQCVRIIAAAGRPSKDAFCLPQRDMSKAKQDTKEIGPQLVWRSDGRLEVTMFWMGARQGPDAWTPAWQKIVDVRTGAVQDVPAADLPAHPNTTTHPLVSAKGDRVTSKSEDGHVEVSVTSRGTSRTLLSVQGPKHYTYGLISAFWGANDGWIAADDGRILIITTGDRPVTRILTDGSSQVTFDGDGRLSRFAVSGTDYLQP